MRRRPEQSLPVEIEAQIMWARKENPQLDVPWMEFSEEEIQLILKAHYEASGFTVQWPHSEDASHERGVDLKCTDARGTRVIIAVKKNPRSEDIAQLLEFARNDAEHRIYVRIKRGTQRFEDETHNVSGVEFWDSRRLEQELDASGLTTLLLLDNSAFATELLSVRSSLRAAARSEGKVERRKSIPLGVLWDLKDRVVTVNKGLSLLQFIFERTSFLRRMTAGDTREFLAPTLKFLSIEGSRPLAEALETQNQVLIGLIRRTYAKTHTRSNWKNMSAISSRAMFRPGIGDARIEYSCVAPSDACYDFFKRLGLLGDGVEGTLDYMLYENAGTLRDEN